MEEVWPRVSLCSLSSQPTTPGQGQTTGSFPLLGSRLQAHKKSRRKPPKVNTSGSLGPAPASS